MITYLSLIRYDFAHQFELFNGQVSVGFIFGVLGVFEGRRGLEGLIEGVPLFLILSLVAQNIDDPLISVVVLLLSHADDGTGRDHVVGLAELIQVDLLLRAESEELSVFVSLAVVLGHWVLLLADVVSALG